MAPTDRIPLYERPESGIIHFKTYLLWCVLTCSFAAIIMYTWFPEIGFSVAAIPIFLTYPIAAYLVHKNKEKYFIQIGNDKIVFKNSVWMKAQIIRAKEIRFIEINLKSIHISTKDMRSFDIRLDHAKHSDMILIKDKIREFRLTALA